MYTPPSSNSSFSHQAAKFSWIAPLIVLGLLTVGKQLGGRVIVELVCLLLMVLGLLFGLISLFGIGKHGTRGILAPAIIGILINGLLVLIFASNFMAARAKAQQQRGAAPTPSIRAR